MTSFSGYNISFSKNVYLVYEHRTQHQRINICLVTVHKKGTSRSESYVGYVKRALFRHLIIF